MRIRGTVVPAESGAYTLALAQAGRARVLVDGVVVVDGVTDPMPPGGTEFFGLASHDRTAEVAATAGQPLAIEVQLDADDAFAPGVRVGFRSPEDPDRLERAVAVAAAAEVAIVLVGTNREWESEGHDRADLTLPGDQSVLVERVAATGTPTIVVVNAGAPIDVTWSDRVAATLMTWLGGQELGPAIADVLTGAAEPGGRLPTTFPARLEHSPAHDNFPGENGQVRYGEGVFTGYRGFEHRAIEPRFAFGHGLGYTTFTFGDPVPSSTTFTPGDRLIVAVRVTNSGPRDGATVVQAYVAPCGSRLARPPKELVAFAKVHVEAGATRTVELVLDDRAFAYWDPGQPDVDTIAARAVSLPGPLDRPTDRRAPGWQVDPGTYDVVIGRSSADLTGRCAVEVVVAEA
jgi:beta-glucosidase